MKYRILYILFKTFYYLLHLMPYKGRKAVTYGLAWLVGRVLKIRRQVAKKNLEKSFPDLSDKKINDIVNDVYLQVSYTLVEFLLSDELAVESLEQQVKIEGEKFLEEAVEREQGIIFYSAHFGNWEWLCSVLAALDYPVTAVAKPQNTILNREIEKIRTQSGLNLIYRGTGMLRKLYRLLKEGKCLILLGDQEAHSKGWKVNFLNRPASAYKGVVQLAAKTGAAIVPVFLVRQKLGHHKLHVKKPVYVAREANQEEKKEKLQHLTDLFSEVITAHKSQWLWLHRRWKTYD